MKTQIMNLFKMMGKSLKMEKSGEMEKSPKSLKSLKSLMQIFATYATYASAIFVGEESCKSTVRYALWSRNSLTKPLQNPYKTLTRFRLSLGSNLSRFSLASLICLCMLTVGVGKVWGEEGDTHIFMDFSTCTGTKNLGKSDYTTTWDIAANHIAGGNVACLVYHATSNNVGYLCFGGKNISSIDAYIGTTNATTVPMASVSVKILKITNKSLITINSAKLYVYGAYNSSTKEYSDQIDCVDFTGDYKASTTVSVYPTSGSAWASGVYFKLVINITNTDAGTNDYTSIESFKGIEGASKTLSSIAITTQPTKRKYVQGESFSATGAVVTATYDDSSNADVSASTTWTPSGGLSVGTQTITATCNTKTATTTVDVYAVTMQAKDEDGNAIAVGGPGAPSRTGASISPAADAGNYKFMEWTISGASLSSSATTKSNTITSPTGAVTVTAKYYKPCTVTWMVNNITYSAGGSTSVSYGSRVSALPTDPDPGVYCGNKFMGWTTDAVYVHGTSPLFTTAGSAPIASGAQTFYAVFADYAE